MNVGALSDAAHAGARVALELAESSNRFLPTVQIGITLVGLLAAAFHVTETGAATVEDEFCLLEQQIESSRTRRCAQGNACVGSALHL